MHRLARTTALAALLAGAHASGAHALGAQALAVVTPQGTTVLDRDAVLRTLPADTATIAPHRHGGAAGASVRITGPALRAVLARAGVRTDSLRGERLRWTVRAEGADGYAVTFSLGELAPDLGQARVLVAIAADGGALDPRDGPLRLVVPGDARQARWVRQLVRLVVGP